MVSLGPRVGGAHVDVNLKFDDKSLNAVGKRIHQHLSDIGDHNRQTYQSIGRSSVLAWRAALGASIAAAPHIGSLTSALAGGATVLAGSLYSVGQSSGALLPIVTSLGVAGLTASIGMRNFGAAVSETNPKRLQELLKDMPKSMQKAVLSTRKLSNEMRAAVWPKLFDGLGDGIERLRETGVIQRGLGSMADSLNYLARSVLDYANTKEGVSTLDKFFQNNAKVFKELSKAAVPFLDGFLRLINALTPAALRLADRITDIGERFQAWTKGEGFGKRVDDSMKKAEKTAGLLWNVLTNLGSAIRNIFDIANPSTNTFLQMLVDVTQRFEDFTKDADGKSSIATWASQSVEVMRQLGHTIEAMFKVFAELSDPRVITSFLVTLENAFNIIGKLPLDKLVTAFVTLAEALQPISGPMLAIIIAGASLNILLGTLTGQLGGVVSFVSKIVFFVMLRKSMIAAAGGAHKAGGAMEGAAKKTGLLSRAWDFVVRMFTKVKNAFAKFFGFGKKTADVTGDIAGKAGKFKGAFKPVLSILGRFAKFAGPVGVAIWIGSIIARSDKLKAKLGKTWDALKEVGSALKGAFDEVKTALEPLAPVAKAVGKAFGIFFDFADKIAGFAIGLIIDTITYALKSLANVITGVGRILGGFITLIIGLATFDGDKIIAGLKKMVSGIWPLLKGLFGLFITFFAPARLFKIASLAFKGLGGGIVRAIPGILGFVGRLVGSILRWIGRLPGKLLSLGFKAITKLGGAILRGTPKVLAAAGRIYLGVVKWILRLPGRLFQLGMQTIARLGRAVGTGVGRLGGIASRIVSKVVNIIKGLPGKMLNIGKNIIQSLIDGVTWGIGKLKGAVSKVADVIGKFFPGSPVREGPLMAWNRGGGATGGGRNVIDAISGGLANTDPIRKAMRGVATAVSASLTPTVGAGVLAGAGSVTNSRNMNIVINNPRAETGSESLTRTTRNLAYLGLA